MARGPDTPDGAGGRLGALQEAFLADLTEVRPRSADERRGVFRAPPRGTVEDRFHVYRTGYLARLVETIGHDYAAVRRVVGESAWRSLVARYVRACPPSSFDVSHAGRRLAEFLDADPLRERLPFLGDLARLEGALAAAFVAPDAAALDWSDLRGLGPEAAADLPLRAVPGTVVLHSEWPVGDVKGLVEVPDEEVNLEVTGRPADLLVWRRAFTSRWRELDAAEAQVARALVAGTTLAELAAASPSGDEPGSATALIDTVRRFVGDGVVQQPGLGKEKE